MKPLVLLFSSFLLLVSASGSVAPHSLPVTIGGQGSGQVCPVGPNTALTARHVAFEKVGLFPNELAPVLGRWADVGQLEGGVITGRTFILSLDIARATSDNPFPFFYEVSGTLPKIGDVVYIDGYDWNKAGKPVHMKVKIVGIAPGVMYTDKTPGPGSSGSCVFNEAGQVVGINFGSMSGDGPVVNGIFVVLTPDLMKQLEVEGE